MKKVLLVSYYWPPAGGPGVQRWLKFVTHLPDYGIKPILFLPEDPVYPLQDESLLKEVPEGLTIYRAPIREPLRWASKLRPKRTRSMSAGQLPGKKASFLDRIFLWIRANLFIPDARVGWVRPSVPRVLEILEKENIDTLVTTGPPHSVHLIGKAVKARRTVRWVADFRDPWTSIGYHQELPLGKRAERRHRELERTVLQGADHLIVTSRTTGREFRQHTDTPIKVITNGFDEKDYQQVEAGVSPHFLVSHIGSLLRERNPLQLWEVLAELREADPDFRRDMRLQLAGTVSPEVLEAIRSAGLEDCLELPGYLPHHEAIGLQKQAQMLLLLEIDRPETRGIIPGKLFEYLASGRPILAMGPTQWEAGAMVHELGAGSFHTYADKPGVKQAIQSSYQAYRKGRLYGNPEAARPYSRKALTSELAKLLRWES